MLNELVREAPPPDPRYCCGGTELPQEVSDKILEWRVAICERCSFYSMGMCGSTLVDLPRNIRRIGVACPVGRW